MNKTYYKLSPDGMLAQLVGTPDTKLGGVGLNPTRIKSHINNLFMNYVSKILEILVRCSFVSYQTQFCRC